MNLILENCLNKLGNKAIVLNEVQTNELEQLLEQRISFGNHGVDWSKYPNNIVLESIRDLSKRNQNDICFIMWDEGTLPIIKSSFDNIESNIEDIIKVAFDTWIVSANFDWLLEFHHSGNIRYANL